MKKTLSFIIVSVLLSGGFVFAQTVSLPDTTGLPGSTIMIPVYTTEVLEADEVGAFQMEITYDTGVAACDAYSTDNTIVPSSWFNLYNLQPGNINGGAFMTSTPYLTGEGVLVWLEFVIPAAVTGTSDLEFELFLYNETPVQTMAGSITIEEGLLAVEGYAYLQNQTVHTGISVEFTETTSGQVSATETDSLGSYSLEVEAGTYDISYSFPGYEEYMVDNQVIDDDIILPDVTLMELPSVTVDGNVFLQGQTVHDGSMVAFTAVSAGALSDTAYSDAAGYFTVDLFPGTYNVDYTHDGYESAGFTNQLLEASITFGDVTLIEIPEMITVSIPDILVDQGTWFSLPIDVTYISSYVDVMSYSMQISFDETLIVASPTPFTTTGTLIPDGWQTSFNTSTPGEISGGSYGFSEELSGQGVLIYLNLHSTFSSGVTDVTFDMFIFNNGEPVALTVNGSIEVSTGVNEIDPEIIPEIYALGQNFPNPFNPETTISFDLPKESMVNVSVYNVLGELVTVLHDGSLSTGTYEVEWNAAGLPTGLYFYRLQAGNYVETRKMMLLE